MPDTEILAGPETDELVAAIINWKPIVCGCGKMHTPTPKYSSEHGPALAAFEAYVVPRARAQKEVAELVCQQYDGHEWTCGIRDCYECRGGDFAQAPTLPLAICRYIIQCEERK